MRKRFIVLILLSLLVATVCLTCAAASAVPQVELSWNHPNDTYDFYIGMDYEYRSVYPGKPQSSQQLASFWARVIDSGDEPVWDIRLEKGNIEYAIDDARSAYSRDIVLKKMPTAPTEVTFRVTCSVDDASETKDFTIRFVNCPASLPTGIVMQFTDPLNVSEGDQIQIPATFADNWSISGYPIEVYLGGGMNIWEGVSQGMPDSDGYPTYVAAKAGTYDANVTVQCANVQWMEKFTLRIADASGNVPDPVDPGPGPGPGPNPGVPDVSGDYRFLQGQYLSLDQPATYYVDAGIPLDWNLLEEDIADDTLYSACELFSYGVENMASIAGNLTADPTFSVTLKSGQVSYETTEWLDHSHITVWLTQMPAAGKAQFEVTCTVDGQTYSETANITFAQLTGKPTGVTTGFTDPMILRSGDVLPSQPLISFENGWKIGQYNWSKYGNHDIWFYNAFNWRQNVTALTPGVYDIPLLAMASNLYIQRTIRFIITNADGTMNEADYTPYGPVNTLPANTSVIDSQAFAGTKMTELDIPAGVTTIAEDAFDGSGLIAIYTHNKQETIDYATDHGFVALVNTGS